MAARNLGLLQQFMYVHLKVFIAALFTILWFTVQEIAFEGAEFFFKKISAESALQHYKPYHFRKESIEWLNKKFALRWWLLRILLLGKLLLRKFY